MIVHPLPGFPAAAALYAAIRHLPWAFWLDSGDEGGAAGQRYHILVAAPRWRVVSQGGATTITGRDGRVRETTDSPLEVIRRLLGRPRTARLEVPFAGGAVGYFSYDFGRRLEGLSVQARLPEVAVGIFDWAIVVDKQKRRGWLAGRKIPRGLLKRLSATLSSPPQASTGGRAETVIEHETTRAEYARAFTRIQRYLHDGDCYQVNFAQRFSLRFAGDSWPLYLAMRQQNPAPYGAYLPFPFAHLLSSSPEQFLQLKRGRVTTRPIKGTRPRGRTPEEDEQLSQELQRSAKDRAENVMIVDLLRNDLGRVCQPGSIEVPELFRVKRFATVLHLVSRITGHLAPGEDALSLLGACFPGGSITGAPKHRAMQIIQELEHNLREVYCGSIGWIGFDGNMESNIAIRTLQISEGVASYWAGGGIVADSRVDEEYQESLDKAAAFFRLFGQTSDLRSL